MNTEQEPKAEEAKVDWLGDLIPKFPKLRHRKTPAGWRAEWGIVAFEVQNAWLVKGNGIPWFLIGVMSVSGFAIGLSLAGFSLALTFAEDRAIS